jgi:hypothetical protein
MRIPESFKRLLTNFRVRGSVHQEHAQKHNVASDAACLGVVYLDSSLLTNLRLFDIEETF